MPKTIILYNPSAVFYDMPLALLAIGTPLAKDFNVVIIDARIEENIEVILDKHINDTFLVGVTSLTGAPLKDAIRFSNKIKELNPNIPVVWGGWHTSLFPEQVLKDVSSVDISVQGQGEESFQEIANAVEQGMELDEIKGIVFRKSDNSIVKTPPRLMSDMNSFERLNYDLIDVEKYFEAKGRRQFDFITSTGCFFRCTFCADPHVFSRKFTSLDPERIFEDLHYYHQKYQFDDVNFQDETFFTYPKNILALAEKLKAVGSPFSWAATMRADQGSRMSYEDFKICKESGLRRLLIGVESGSQEMMDWLKKDIKMEQVLLCAERCKNLGIGVIFPFIVGFPGESEQSVEATKNMIRKLAFMSQGFETPVFYFKPYPGTQITKEVVANKSYKLPSSIEEWAEFDYVGSKGPWVSDALFKEMELLKFYLRARRKNQFFLRPLKWASHQRVKNMNFKLPVEKLIVERLKPKKELS
ncbi:MAG: B12-binding domain-containing radical SAM protein [Fluviicola sp.]